MVAGNPGKRALNTSEPQPKTGAPSRPEWLLPEAKREWNRVLAAYEGLQLITWADRAALSAYCQSWARYVEAEQRLTAMQAEDGHDEMDLRRQAMVCDKRLVEMLALGGKFGLNPSDRSRISMSEAKPVDEFSAFLAAKAVNE